MNNKQFLELLKKYTFDSQAFFKKIANTSIYMLLDSKPEQEQALLNMLVEKIGDPDNTVFLSTIRSSQVDQFTCSLSPSQTHS